MISAISSATQPQPVVQSAKPATSKAVAVPPKSSAAADSAQLSQAAQAMLAALKEAKETPSQTAQEAGSGDVQAQRLLAKQAAAKTV